LNGVAVPASSVPGLNDALGEAGVWHDDAHVAELVATKAYVEQAGLRVRVTEVAAP